MKYQTYTKYKPSGIEWIGEIPNNWSINRFKFFYKSNMGQTIIAIDLVDDGKYPVVSATEKDKYFGKIDNPNFILKKGDFVIPARGNSIGFVKKVYEKCTCTQTTIYCKKNGLDINTDFIHYYLLNCKDYLFPFTATAIPQITVDGVKENPVVIPTEDDQQNIADFLDKKTLQIDNLIKKDKQLIELLKERRIALINKAVTKGLDDKAKLVDSGVDWIGEIPKGWEVRKLKLMAKVCNGQDQKDVLIEDGGYPIYGTGGEFGRASKYLYNKKSVLLGRKGTIDKPQYTEEPFWTVDTLFYTRIMKDTFAKFFYYVAQRIDFYKYSETTTVPSMTQEKLNEILLPCPSYEKQKEIAEYIDNKTEKIDKHIRKVVGRIHLLEEYKKSLIYNAVTGKIKV